MPMSRARLAPRMRHAGALLALSLAPAAALVAIPRASPATSVPPRASPFAAVAAGSATDVASAAVAAPAARPLLFVGGDALDRLAASDQADRDAVLDEALGIIDGVGSLAARSKTHASNEPRPLGAAR